jgi:hypothetical protein
MLTPKEFYRDIYIIRRMLEYCGVPYNYTKDFQLEPNLQYLGQSQYLKDIANCSTVEYLSMHGAHTIQSIHKKNTSRKPTDLGWFLDEGENIFTSVWDKKNLRVFIDVEYFSNRRSDLPFTNPRYVFNILEPVYWCIWDTFKEYGIKPITLATGQGYHFVFNIPSYIAPNQPTSIVKKIEDLGDIEGSLLEKYLDPKGRRDRPVEYALGRAYDGLGKLLEFFMHKVMARLPSYGLKLPVSFGDLTVGNQLQETINLDLSSLADPLYTRVMRSAFSIHNKALEKGYRCKDPICLTIPRYTPCNGNTLSLDEVFDNRNHYQNTCNYAKEITAEVPYASQGVESLIWDYTKSSLYKFHQEYDSIPIDSHQDWWKGYDSFDTRQVPPCIQEAFNRPNPRMLQPNYIQALVRTLHWWNPKHVAGLITSKYTRDYNWDYNWKKYDAYRHAKVWTRFYAGLLAVGLDRKQDHNCVSYQERDLCNHPFCGYNIGNY